MKHDHGPILEGRDSDGRTFRRANDQTTQQRRRYIVRMPRAACKGLAVQGERNQFVRAQTSVEQFVHAHDRSRRAGGAGTDATPGQNRLENFHFQPTGIAEGLEQTLRRYGSDITLGMHVQRCAVNGPNAHNTGFRRSMHDHPFSGGRKRTSQGIKTHVHVGNRCRSPYLYPLLHDDDSF